MRNCRSPSTKSRSFLAVEAGLAGRVALVTGSSKGIGAETGIALAQAGAHVILTGRDVKALETVEDRVHEVGGMATIAPLDLTEQDAIARLAAAIAERWDRLDICILSAAYLPTLTPVAHIDQTQLAEALMTNVVATQSLLAAFDPLIKRAPSGRVVGLTSSVAQAPRAYWGAYAASKAAFETLLECYAREVEKIGAIRVAIVDPGATRTAMRAKAFPGEDPQTVKPADVVAARIVALLHADFPSLHRERVTG